MPSLILTLTKGAIAPFYAFKIHFYPSLPRYEFNPCVAPRESQDISLARTPDHLKKEVPVFLDVENPIGERETESLERGSKAISSLVPWE